MPKFNVIEKAECYKCEKDFKMDCSGEWGSANTKIGKNFVGINFCPDCWEDEVDNCKEDEEKYMLVWKCSAKF